MNCPHCTAEMTALTLDGHHGRPSLSLKFTIQGLPKAA